MLTIRSSVKSALDYEIVLDSDLVVLPRGDEVDSIGVIHIKSVGGVKGTITYVLQLRHDGQIKARSADYDAPDYSGSDIAGLLSLCEHVFNDRVA